MSTNPSSEDLNRQYQAIITLPEQAFFIGVANYVRSLLDNPDLASILSKLSQKAQSDYDRTIEVVNEKDSLGDPKKSWKMADFIQAGKNLVEKRTTIKGTYLKQQIEASHAWMRLQTLELFLHNREKAKSIYSKTPTAQHQFKLSIAELDVILSTKENERDNDEYEFWVESGLKKDMKSIPRSIFVQSEYQNYLSQVHLYLLAALSKKNVSSTIIFPEGETVLYRKGIIYFYISDSTHDFIDFSTSPDLKKIFDVFWDNWKRTRTNSISPSKALTLYEALHGETVTRSKFSSDVSHINSTKLDLKPHLKERLKINFNRQTDRWDYNWQ